MKQPSPALLAGVIAGLVFFAHAMINDSHAWPMIWPLVAGSGAILLAARKHRLQGFGSGLWIATKAGAIAGALFFATTVAALAAMSSFNPAIAVTGNVVMMLGAVGLSAVVLALLAGAVTFPVARARSRT